MNQTVLHASLREFLSADQVVSRTRNCQDYFALMHPTHFLSNDYSSSNASDPNSPMYKKSFSVAFAHLLHKEPGIFELFMLLYFRPHNSHCVHIDAKVILLLLQLQLKLQLQLLLLVLLLLLVVFWFFFLLLMLIMLLL